MHLVCTLLIDLRLLSATFKLISSNNSCVLDATSRLKSANRYAWHAPERNCGDNFFDRAKSWAKNWAKNWAKFSGHFRASFTVKNDPAAKILPKFLPIYHSMSCHGSCDWNLKISSPRASGAWGAQLIGCSRVSLKFGKESCIFTCLDQAIGKTTILNTFISATDPPLFLGVDACRDPGEGQFWIGFRSVFGRVLVGFGHFWPNLSKNWPRIDPKSTLCKVFDQSVLFMRGDGLWLK